MLLKHTRKILENPIKLDSKEELTKWLFDIHNKVNESNGKSLYDYDDFIDKYSEMYNPIDRKIFIYNNCDNFIIDIFSI